MSSTEQKNVSHPFIDCCHHFGILPTLASNTVCHPELDTNRQPFVDLGPTRSIGSRCRDSDNPITQAITLFPVLASTPPVTRDSCLLLKLASDSSTFVGNQGVCRLAEGILTCRWSLHFRDNGAIKHASRHVHHVASFLAPGSYGEVGRTDSSVRKLAHRKDGYYLRVASDVFDYLSRCPPDSRFEGRIRSWCAANRQHTPFASFYRDHRKAIADYLRFSPETLASACDPPELRQKFITTSRSGPVTISLRKYRGKLYISLKSKYGTNGPTQLCSPNKDGTHLVSPKYKRLGNELYILTQRDLADLAFLLTAVSHVRLYFDRRELDIVNKHMRYQFNIAHQKLWSLYLAVIRLCGNSFALRNKLGVYFDVLQWRYLAWKSGDIFYNHSTIMGNKVQSKGLSAFPDQSPMLATLKSLPMDIAVDMLGIYKASIYPEVDPFKVIGDQYALHMSRFVTDWPANSPERVRFDETRSYMWYLGIRVLNNRFGVWPGAIREGTDEKGWHKMYKKEGVPSDAWRDSWDICLKGAVTVADITNEQYMKQQDSACAPPLWREYRDYNALQKAPRRHRRKLLYAIQEPVLEDLPSILRDLNHLGQELPDGYVGKIDYVPRFSTDIVTGSRCERHKDAPRPFYAASPPWGCILSYFDGITRDFLSHVPQSMLGKSTRQKYLDLYSTATSGIHADETFYMSDDKAKYSPHMDPHSQQLPAEFFAELFDIPGIRAYGPVMYHCELYYRVHGHLVHYNSNGTDREGMRGASNTWLEVVAQGLSTRLCRERGLIRGKSTFLSFIDDGLRKFSVEIKNRTPELVHGAAIEVINDVIFGLRVLGRELSWDKTFISRDLFVILNELMYDGSFVSSGLKSFCTVGDIDMKEVMSAADYEQLYFGKLRGAHSVGAPLDLCHYVYLFETLVSHFRMGVNLQDNRKMRNIDYRLFCMSPIALGGAGIRSGLQLACNEVASATKEGIGNLARLGSSFPPLQPAVYSILQQPIEALSPIDFMREPEQFHVSGARLKTQRLAAEVRKHLNNIAANPMSREMLEQDAIGMRLLGGLGTVLMATKDVSAEEVRLLYSTTPVAYIDEFVQKLASSQTLSELIGRDKIRQMRRMVRNDLRGASESFSDRCRSRELFDSLGDALNQLAMMKHFLK